MSKVMFVVGVTFLILPWLSLQGLKQYLNTHSNKIEQLTTISEGIAVQVLDTTDADNGFSKARANLAKSILHNTNLDLVNTNKLTNSSISLRRPISIPMPTPNVDINFFQTPNIKPDMGLAAGISPDYEWPLSTQGVITSNFGVRYLGAGNFHYGIDIAAITGTAIVASQGGTVTYANWQGGYGQVVFLSHYDGSETRYAHMSRILVSEGQQITQGEKLGEVGSTGFATGPHLHFEVHIDGEAVNPVDYLLAVDQVASTQHNTSHKKQIKANKS